MDLDHEGQCKCSISKEKHICNRMCSSNNCEESCGLVAGHKELCICGKCSCGEKCKFINCSRNCRKKCKENYEHKEEHICEENEGCKELCRFQ